MRANRMWQDLQFVAGTSEPAPALADSLSKFSVVQSLIWPELVEVGFVGQTQNYIAPVWLSLGPCFADLFRQGVPD